jgi:hypothetical protein
MNEQTWQVLQENGVSEETPLALDFSYAAPGRSAAEQLRDFLTEETDYAVSVQPQKKGLLSKTWSVQGTTRPTPVSLDILNDWVRWMVAAGAEKGGCIFDGWGALAPG